MMTNRKFACWLLFLGATFTVSAQERLEISQLDLCSYYGEEINEDLYAFDSDQQARELVTEVVSYVGLEPNFRVIASNVPNAAAVIREGNRLLVYSQSFIKDIIDKTGTRWAAVSIMAHEIGHHLNGHTLQGESRPEKELEADRFSGHILYKMGASLEEAKVAMTASTNDSGSRTHPPKGARLAAIHSGWIASYEQNKGAAAVTPEVNQDKQNEDLQARIEELEKARKAAEDRASSLEEQRELDDLLDEYGTQDQPDIGNYCCDAYLGNPVCQMTIALPVGSVCSCYMFGMPVGTGLVCN